MNTYLVVYTLKDVRSSQPVMNVIVKAISKGDAYRQVEGKDVAIINIIEL